MTEKSAHEKTADVVSYHDKAEPSDVYVSYEGFEAPTEEDWKTLRQVPDKIPFSAFLVIIIEFCERFTYYGLSGPFQNYIQNPAPASYPAEKAGAMGKGQQTATALTTFFQFWCYITPIIGAVIADQYLGKYRAILLFSIIYFIGLIILTLTSIPPAIESGAAFPGFIVSIIIIGLGTGGIKSNVAPLVAEQYQSRSPYIRTDNKGNRVIVSPQATYQQIFSYFYWGINIGALSAIATTELEKNVGFWPAYLLPTIMFMFGIATIFIGRKRYIQAPPRGSIFVEVGKLFMMKIKVKDGLEACKPSNLAIDHPDLLHEATWDDVFVDELKRALRACIIFCWYPIFWLCYSQMTNNLISMAGTMLTGNVPNDIMQNIDPLTLIIAIPVFDRVIFPGLRRCGINLGPITRIALGFFFAAVAMGYSAGIQAKVYQTAPYYDHPDGRQNWISAAYQIPSYFFTAISEVFASITGNEYAYKKAPESMKSIVMALFLFTNCIASILGFALVSVAVDPKLTWMYTGIGCASFICSVLIFVLYRKYDKTDVEDDAIGRNDSEREKYQKKMATIEYEVEKGPV
ncbi:POT family-domain-containing protein [Mycotypha africana]|uniref:POT family-domain-containing protein n=1 Tax=Mycotypha africana TaxID=64632 RepID=UPI002301AB9A|nr:POT family-domain-containing protein [Mycotypha africana]KAI8992110.1 POT family-domain-containing protein [Mycotypha africana]